MTKTAPFTCEKRRVKLFFFTFTKVAERAGGAFRRARGAGVSAELHYAVAKIALLFGLDKLCHDCLDLMRVLELFGIHSKSSANADAMRVRDDGGHFIYVAEHEVGYLSADSVKSAELLGKLL